MGKVGRRADPRRRAARAKLVGVALQTAGIFAGVAGLYLFGGVFLDNDPRPSLVAPAVGLAALLVGGGLGAAGWRMLVRAGYRQSTRGPAVEVFTGRIDHRPPPAREPTPAGLPPPEPSGVKLQHECGAWNDPFADFCKRCGRALNARSCPSCRALNDPDAHFCRGCGSPMLMVR